ncbi:MAG: endonuclease/exonuclease/phosphatase family protein [Verrucomicrobia bacterium]|nr:endonuclease/exonuclease/phosphatase family protein [Verrucomicrobiota bacterium]
MTSEAARIPDPLTALLGSPTAKAALGLARRFLTLASYLYLAALCLALAGLEWWAEGNWFFSFCLFLPPFGWLLPLFALAPLSLPVRPLLLLLHALAAVLLLVFYMDFQWSSRPAARGPTVTLVTNNYGESGRTRPLAFADEENADFIALQDIGLRARSLATNYPNFYFAAQDQFALISRWPIVNYDVVPVLSTRGRPVAARFEVERDGRRLVIYNVHLPTPRHQLESMTGLGFLAAVAGRDGRYGGKLRQENQNFWNAQIGMADKLAGLIQAEKLPCLVAGDFNAPNHGRIYRRFSDFLADSFKARGRGFGFTFPGATRNPVSAFGPWLRIDYVFSSAELKPIYSRAEPSRPSQHRAVAARFEFNAQASP